MLITPRQYRFLGWALVAVNGLALLLRLALLAVPPPPGAAPAQVSALHLALQLGFIAFGVFLVRRHAPTPYEAVDELERLALKRGLGALTPRQQQVVRASVFESEVNNGGFDQYFFNSSGDQAGELAGSLIALGATDAAALAAEACSRFPGGRPDPDRERRCEQLEAMAGPEEVDLFQDLDTRFYALPGPLIDKLNAHLKTR